MAAAYLLRCRALCLMALVLPASGTGWASTLTNPTRRAYDDEIARLEDPAPGPAGSFVVMQDGAEVPYQVESIDGKPRILVCCDFEPEQSHTYRVLSGRPKRLPPKVRVRREGKVYVLDNGLVAVKVPAESGSDLPGPIAAVRRADNQWVGGSVWRTSMPLKRFSAAVVGDGTVLAKVRLRYDFEGMAGLYGSVPAFAEIDVVLGPGWKHVEIVDSHEMSRGDYWEFEASRGWAPREGVSQAFSGGAGSGLVGGRVEPRRPLRPGGLPYGREDLFLNLFPRWNQHYKDGWYFAATDGTHYLGAVVVSAGRWVWPHQNSLQAVVKPSGDYAGLRGSTWKGRRVWWLVGPAFNGPDLDPADIEYVARYAWENLDKLNHEFILDWPGRSGKFSGMDFYNGGQMNPSGGIRGIGRRAMADAGKDGDLSTLWRTQIMMHSDAWGSYWNYWSPENPNFFTDFIRVPVALTTNLKGHPRFGELRRAAELKLREDMYHSVTLPGGASQECPGYVGYALGHWTAMAEICRRHLGFDPTKWERYRAAEYFRKRTTQPDGKVRRMLPMGDTHPGKDGSGPKLVEVSAAEVRGYRTEELPGFGVLFTNHPGTPQETYLAFKGGPNRGHYHGDQLAFHYCTNAKATAVDHHCSYNPRAGQEHMHNRVAFHTKEFPYANMDGYERLIAFKTSAACDMAVGQVESARLRRMEKLPPEIWHQEYPQHRFDKPLVYRRTVVFMKGRPQDYFVLRDQFRASEALRATYCLHVRSDRMQPGDKIIDFGNLSLFCAHPAEFDFEAFPWSHNNGGREATQGARLTIRADHGEFITVLYPGRLPAIRAVEGGVRVGADEIVFAGDGLDAAEAPKDGSAAYVSVSRDGRTLATLSAKDVDLDRSQGEIGLFVPDAGYPFGEIPNWLIRQRAAVPDWAPSMVRRIRQFDRK